ncbi:hypothetical protein [Zhengella mangrovi]|uniref:YobI family P-loop NTPase n=1 Tax=Zhengella mangrovi TaxID=1982044 RepID=UPI00315A3AB5
MSERIAALTNWLAARLIGLADFLESMGSSAATPSKFVNLAPTDQADKDGVYSEALDFATADPKVYNIALTGPYGSGKSSIIQSFLKKHPRSKLHISLAAFAHEAAPVNGEPPRDCRRPQLLRGRVYEQDNEQVFPRGSRTGGSDGSRQRERSSIALGGSHFHRRQGRLFGLHAA